MKKILGLCTMVILMTAVLLVGCSKTDQAGKTTEEEKEYNYYTAEQVKDVVENNKDVFLLDIQVEEDYNKHHIKGTVPVYAYPVETKEEQAKIDTVLQNLEKNENPIVVVCPGGGGGATRTIDYLTSKGIKSDRLFILENGQKGWPYDELLEK